MPGKNILVVDDDSKSANTIIEVLESEGYAVFAASNKSSSTELATKIQPALIFVSAILTDASGLEVTRTIRSIADMESVPIIMLTEMEEEYNERYSSAYGIINFVKKPINPRDLISKTTSVVSLDVSVKNDFHIQDKEQGFSGPEEEIADDIGSLAYKSFEESEDLEEPAETEAMPEKVSSQDKDRIRIKVKRDSDDEFIPPEVSSEEVSARSENINEGFKFLKDALTTPKEDNTLHEIEDLPKDESPVEQEIPSLEGVPAFSEASSEEKPPGEEEKFELDEQTSDEIRIQDTQEVTDEQETVPPPIAQRDQKQDSKTSSKRPLKVDEIFSEADTLSKMESAVKEGTPGKKIGKILVFSLVGVVIVSGLVFALARFTGIFQETQQTVLQVKEVTTQKPDQPTQEVPVEPAGEDQTGIVVQSGEKGIEPGEAKSPETAAQQEGQELPGGTMGQAEKQLPSDMQADSEKVSGDVRIGAGEPEKEKSAASVVQEPSEVISYKYAVQVGFFQDFENASAFMNRLKGKGYNAHIKKEASGEGVRFRVLVGKYNTRREARNTMRKLKRVEKMDSIIHKP